MAKLEMLYIYLNTSRANEADSDSGLALIYTSSDDREHEYRLGGLPHDERERGRTDFYVAGVIDSPDELRDIRGRQFRLVALGGDAWLPQSVFVIGQSGDRFRVLVGIDSWPSDAWFSTDLTDVGGKAAGARLLVRDARPVLS